MDRRKFVKSSCALCATVMAVGIVSSVITGCASLPIYKGAIDDRIINIPLTSFAEGNMVIVRNNKLSADILIVKKSATESYALEMKCTHQDVGLSATTTGLYCTAHGSTFDIEGNVTKEPALKPLKRYKTEINNKEIKLFFNT